MSSRCDTSGLSAEPANAMRLAHRKQKGRAARNKYTQKRNPYAEAALVGLSSHFKIKSLDTVSAERGGADRYVPTGDVYESKAEIIHRACEVAEYFCLILRFIRNCKAAVKSIAESFHGFNFNPPASYGPIFIHATLRMEDA